MEEFLEVFLEDLGSVACGLIGEAKGRRFSCLDRLSRAHTKKKLVAR